MTGSEGYASAVPTPHPMTYPLDATIDWADMNLP